MLALALCQSARVGAAGWTPAALGSSLLGYWDAEDSSSFTQSGGLVSSWRDKVAGYDVVQATGSLKPVYSATSFNSRPGVTFDGVDDVLALQSVPFPIGAAPVEIWALVDQTAAGAVAGSKTIAAYGGGAAATDRRVSRLSNNPTNQIQAFIGDGAAGVSAVNAAVDFTGRHVTRFVIGATATRADIDGFEGAPSSVVPSTGSLRTTLGATTASTSFFQGVQSAILVTAPLTSGQAAQLYTYLKTRGGIA
jgi:hypothetical protein